MSMFQRLAPFIQDYIYRHRWQELREIQVAACDIIFDTDNNLLISTPTASGKTEAAFLPIITEIYNKPSLSVGILYIAPLKALINDQFLRIESLLENTNISLTKWHSDTSLSAKNRLLKRPQGILQITPESLEAMLMKRKESIITLFSDLRFIVIDEIHNFISSDRGVQLSSILERIQILTGNTPRRIGLSATLGDISVAERWLNIGTNRRCDSPLVNANKRKSQIMINHFYTNKESNDEGMMPYYEFLYALAKGKKSIIFSNSRRDVETNINRLRIIAERKKEENIFYVHHGNISAAEREYVETQMRSHDKSLTIGATITLELGIDLGDLERVIQTGSPHSVSSLAQRLGRSGRKSGISQMCFVFNENPLIKSDNFYNEINWEFIKCIALIELYRENWMEPLEINKFPYNILFHQTMSLLYSLGNISPRVLAQKVLSQQTFRYITEEDFKTLLRHMLKTEMLEKTSDGKILIGKKGEWLTNNYEFYSVFENQVEYSVREGAREIGSLHSVIPVGERFILSGKTWEVLEIDEQKSAIYVKFAGGKSTVSWRSDFHTQVHTKVLKKMRQIIISDDNYGYLHENALLRLFQIRSTIRHTGIFSDTHQTDIFRISPNSFGIFPWLGTKALNALKLSLQSKGVQIKKPDHILLHVAAKSKNDLSRVLQEIKNSHIDITRLPHIDGTPVICKYSKYIPFSLSNKQLMNCSIDIVEMQNELHLGKK